MKLKTYHFGEIEFTDDRILNFENGLFGFENFKRFVFIKPDDSFFYWLNSVDNPDISFPLFGMRVLDEKYPQEDQHEAFGIITLNSDPLKITINLKAPVYINQDDKSGFQKILDSENYSLNFNLFVE